MQWMNDLNVVLKTPLTLPDYIFLYRSKFFSLRSTYKCISGAPIETTGSSAPRSVLYSY